MKFSILFAFPLVQSAFIAAMEVQPGATTALFPAGRRHAGKNHGRADLICWRAVQQGVC